MKKAGEGTRDEEMIWDAALAENFDLAKVECWDELERDSDNEYKGEITLAIGRIRMSDGRIGEYQVTLQLDTRKFVDDEMRVEGYVLD